MIVQRSLFIYEPWQHSVEREQENHRAQDKNEF